jgi:hypothetical protein
MSTMKKAKIYLGITWAFAGLVLIIILFPGLAGFSGSLAKLPFMKINPNYTGGETAYTEIAPSCTLVVRKPVFDGLWKERKAGFVQIDWRGTIPDMITDTIDYDRDGSPDFTVSIKTSSAESEVVPISNNARDINVSTPTSYGWALRVNLRKP